MSELKDLVPSLELCKQIPSGHFSDSALVWSKRTSRFAPHEWVIPRVDAAEVRDICPAPTLSEIMLALDEAGYTPGKNRPDVFDEEAKKNPSIAALKLWLELEGEKMNKKRMRTDKYGDGAMFTPGPWEVTTDIFVTKDDQYIAQCFPCMTEKEIVANAKIIAAAPKVHGSVHIA